MSVCACATSTGKWGFEHVGAAVAAAALLLIESYRERAGLRVCV